MRDRCKWLRDAEILKSNANQEKADPPIAADLIVAGRWRRIFCLTLKRLRRKIATPAQKTIPSAICQLACSFKMTE